MPNSYNSRSWRTARIRLAAVLAVSAVFTSISPAAEQVDLIVRGGTIVTMDAERRVIENGAVAVRRGVVAAVGPADDVLAKFAAPQTLEARGRLVVPGLVNTHGHAAMSLMRGLADDRALMDWLQNYIFPAEARVVDEEFVRVGTRLACCEMLLGGTTTYADMYYFEQAVAEETAQAGMRGVLGQTVIDFPAPDFKTWDAALAGCEAFLVRWKDHPLIVPAVAPHAPYTVSPEHLQAARALANRHHAPLVIHVAETKSEVATIRERHQASPVAHLERLGLFDGATLANHCVWTDDADLALLAKRGVGVAHCPQSNMKLASGVAPVPKMLALRIAVGLGTDGAASNNDLDLWEEIDAAAKLHKAFSGDPTVISAREAFAMATIEGARALGSADRIGSLEVGKQADLTTIALDAPHVAPLYDVYSHLAYSVKAGDVRTVLVAGRVVVDERRPTNLDVRKTLAEAAEQRVRILAALKKPEPVR